MDIFTNQYEHTIDSKGRMFIPSKYRDMLGTSLYIGKGSEGNLFMMSTEGWLEYVDKVTSTLSMTADQKVMRKLFSNVTEVQIDSQGRILIPAKYLEYAGIESEAVIAGSGPRAEIWSPERWKAADDATDLAEIEEVLAKYRL